MNKKIMIYGNTQEVANKKLRDVVEYKIPASKIERKAKDFILLTNGDLYRAVTGSVQSKGCRWNYAYIDVFIPASIINEVILPTYVGETGCNWDDSDVKFEWF